MPESVQYVKEMSDESSWISNELSENSPVSSATRYMGPQFH